MILLAPLVAAAWGRWRRLAIAGALAFVAFAATSPYVILRFGDAVSDAARVQRAAREGWLGFENDPAAPIAFVERLWDGLGPVLLVAVVGLVLALVHRTRADLVLAVFCLVYFAQLLTIEAHFDRYILPLIPALGALAGRLRSIAPVTLLLLTVPLTWSVRETRVLTKTDTRIAAYSWIVENVPEGARIAVDPSTPDLTGYRVVHLLLPRPGRPSTPNRDVDRLRDKDRFLVLTGAVEDRVLAARAHYRARRTSFRRPGVRASGVFQVWFHPDGRFGGPWVEVFRL